MENSKEVQQVQEALRKHTVKELIPKDFKLISVLSTDPITKALTILTQNRIQSVPVFQSSGEVDGILELLDLVTGMCFMLASHKDFEKKRQEKIQFKDFIDEVYQLFLKLPIAEFTDLSENSPWYCIKESQTLDEIGFLFNESVNFHRIPVQNENEDIIGLITQFGFISFLYKYLKENNHHQILNSQIKNYKSLYPKNIRKINSNQTALEGFQQIAEGEVTGIPIVNSAGQLEGVLSVSDLPKNVWNNENLFTGVYLNIKDYLLQNFPQEKSNNNNANTNNNNNNNNNNTDNTNNNFCTSLNPLFCTENDTLDYALKLICENHVHRLILVDSKESRVAVTVLSLCFFISTVFPGKLNSK